MILLKTSSQKNKKEVTRSSIMKKEIRKILIVQLTLMEVILFVLLFDSKRTSCAIETENNKLLVYNYRGIIALLKSSYEIVALLTLDETCADAF